MISRRIGKKKESKLHNSIVGIISIFIHLNMYIVKKKKYQEEISYHQQQLP